MQKIMIVKRNGVFVLLLIIFLIFGNWSCSKTKSNSRDHIIVLDKNILAPFTMNNISRNDSVYFEPYIGYYFCSEKRDKIRIGFNNIIMDEYPLPDNYKERSIDYFYVSIKINEFNIDSIASKMKCDFLSREFDKIENKYKLQTDNDLLLEYWLTSDSAYYNMKIYLLDQ